MCSSKRLSSNLRAIEIQTPEIGITTPARGSDLRSNLRHITIRTPGDHPARPRRCGHRRRLDLFFRKNLRAARASARAPARPPVEPGRALENQPQEPTQNPNPGCRRKPKPPERGGRAPPHPPHPNPKRQRGAGRAGCATKSSASSSRAMQEAPKIRRQGGEAFSAGKTLRLNMLWGGEKLLKGEKLGPTRAALRSAPPARLPPARFFRMGFGGGDDRHRVWSLPAAGSQAASVIRIPRSRLPSG